MNINHRLKKKKASTRLILITLLTFAFIFAYYGMEATKIPMVNAISTEWNGTVSTSFAGGTGTVTNPYLISTGDQLAFLSKKVNAGTTYLNKFFKLTDDILLNSMNVDGSFVSSTPQEFTSIGSSANKFNGIFDGNGKTIVGLYINEPTKDYQALFAYTNTDSIIKNVSVSGSVTGRNYVAGIVGRVVGTRFKATGATVILCINSCKIAGNNNVGGIVGYADAYSKIRNCLNSGNVAGNTGVGGIVGWANIKSLSIGNNLNLGVVTGSTSVGGIAGLYTKTPTVWNNYYINATAGTGSGDKTASDAAVPVGTRTWAEIVSLLNGLTAGSHNSDSNSIWVLLIGKPLSPPTIGIFVPFHSIYILSNKISSGKYYSAEALGDVTSAAITSDSVFTVSFSTTYTTNCALQTQTIGFVNVSGTAVSIPTGTSITMLADGSYYYVNLQSAQAKISLSQFRKMGSTPAAFYAPVTSAQANDQKSYLFIFDLTETSGELGVDTKILNLFDSTGDASGTMPTIVTGGKNVFSLTTTTGAGMLTINLYKTAATGYDYKTDGKIYSYELYLEKNGERLPLPLGTKVNNVNISATSPYVFVAGTVGETNIIIDTSNSINPIESGNFPVQIRAYACSDETNPLNGYLLTTGAAIISITAPAQYAIKVSAQARIFDYSTLPISFNVSIDNIGGQTVKTTLQQKYGDSYVNIDSETNQPLTINGGSATLIIPGGYEKGTYRFLFTLYDSNGIERAHTVENIIIK